MRVAFFFLSDFPDVTLRVRFGRKFEIWFADHVDHFIRRQEITRIEVDAAFSFPDDDLPDRKTLNYVVPILKESGLNAPLVVIENHTVFAKDAHHCREAFSLPVNVFSMRQIVCVFVIAFD